MLVYKRLIYKILYFETLFGLLKYFIANQNDLNVFILYYYIQTMVFHFNHTAENQVEPERVDTQAAASEFAPEELEIAGDCLLGNSSSQSNVRNLIYSV